MSHKRFKAEILPIRDHLFHFDNGLLQWRKCIDNPLQNLYSVFSFDTQVWIFGCCSVVNCFVDGVGSLFHSEFVETVIFGHCGGKCQQTVIFPKCVTQIPKPQQYLLYGIELS